MYFKWIRSHLQTLCGYVESRNATLLIKQKVHILDIKTTVLSAPLPTLTGAFCNFKCVIARKVSERGYLSGLMSVGEMFDTTSVTPSFCDWLFSLERGGFLQIKVESSDGATEG